MTDNRMPNKRGIMLVEPEEMKKKKEEEKEKEKKTYSNVGYNSSRWWDNDSKLEDWMLD